MTYFYRYIKTIRRTFAPCLVPYYTETTKAFVEFVNRDVGKFKNADLMCSFCDRILKTGGEKLSDAEVRAGFLERLRSFFRGGGRGKGC